MKTLFTVIVLFLTGTVLVFFYLHSFDNISISRMQFSDTEKKILLLFDEEDKNKHHEYSPFTDDRRCEGINVEHQILWC